MDKTSEKLRSKHVRTLELLQKTLDENVELRDQIGHLQKGTLHLGQGATPRSNRSSALEDEIHRLKDEHCTKVLELEEASKAHDTKLGQRIEVLQKKTLKLQNHVFTLETALMQSKETLKAETVRWNDERAQLLDENSQLREELNQLKALGLSQNNSDNQRLEQHYESELERLRDELQSVISSEAEARNSLQSASDRAACLQCETEVHLQHLESHRSEIEALRSQFSGANERESVLTQELVGFRNRNSELQSKLSQLQLQSTQSAMHTNAQQQQAHASLISRLSHAEAASEQLSAENRSLHDQLAKLHMEFNRISNSNYNNSHASGSVFAVHVELKRENCQLRAQVEELKQLQKRFLTTAKKKTMSFPAI